MERDYLASHQLGRLATIRADGSPDVVPVGYRFNLDGTIDIGGPNMGSSPKYQNVQRTRGLHSLSTTRPLTMSLTSGLG